jgi:hypothetical protein
MASISLTFTGATMDEIVRLMAGWAPPPAATGRGGASPAAATRSPAEEAALIGRVLAGVNGRQSRRLLALLAEAGLKAESVSLSDALIRDFGVSGGTAFAGMIGPVNRRAMALMGRLLIGYPLADPGARVWQITPEDARAVLEALGFSRD